MKNYIEHLKNERTPHERRRFAMQVAGVVTAFVFIAWVSTIGLHFAQSTAVPQSDNTAATLTAVDASATTNTQY